MREEIETEAASARRLLAILAALGYAPVFRYEKYREEFARRGVVIAIDETPIGTFVEIEGEEAAIDAPGGAGSASPPATTSPTSYRAPVRGRRAARGRRAT